MHDIWCITVREIILLLQARLAFFSIHTSDHYDNVALLWLHLEVKSRYVDYPSNRNHSSTTEKKKLLPFLGLWKDSI